MSALRLCTVCARGGSRGVPGKNLRELAGRPLVARSVDHALASGMFDVVAVSSDDQGILDCAIAAGAHEAVERPEELATDDVPRVAAIVHAVRTVEQRRATRFDVVVELPPTSPLRSPGDVVAVVELLETSGAPNVVTTTPAARNPYYNVLERRGEGVALVKELDAAVSSRQLAPECFDMNDAAWAWRRDDLLSRPATLYPATAMHVMPAERSVDIDSELDLRIAELLLRGSSSGSPAPVAP